MGALIILRERGSTIAPVKISEFKTRVTKFWSTENSYGCDECTMVPAVYRGSVSAQSLGRKTAVVVVDSIEGRIYAKYGWEACAARFLK